MLAKIRRFEENLRDTYSLEYVRCPIHLAIGHEASAVGVCSNLTSNDKVLSYHRSHHHFLAKGGDPKELLYELLGDKRGCSGGKGGSTHLIDHSCGFMGSTAIISGTLPIATGMAHAEKLHKTENIVTVFCGDAGIEEGIFFESLNIASLWNLPILFVIEDNDLSCYTNKKSRQAYSSYKKIAELFDLEFSSLDGSQFKKVRTQASEMISKIRETSRPALLHIEVYRHQEHCGPENDSHLNYRDHKSEWPKRDPLEVLKAENLPTTNSIIENEFKLMDSLYKEVFKELGLEANL